MGWLGWRISEGSEVDALAVAQVEAEQLYRTTFPDRQQQARDTCKRFINDPFEDRERERQREKGINWITFLANLVLQRIFARMQTSSGSER